MPVKPIPEGYHSVTPYLIVDGAQRAIEYYERAFGAKTAMCVNDPRGKVSHAEIRIGDSMVMLADEHPEYGLRGPKSVGGTSMFLALYVEDVDKVFAQALSAGGKQVRPLQDQFYGDRSGTLLDPFGHQWTVATHKEDVSPDEMERRAEAAQKKGAK